MRFRIHARLRTNEFHQRGPCQENFLANMNEYSQPFSSTPSSWLTFHSGHDHSQLGSGTCAVFIFVGLGLWEAFVHGGGSRLPRALDEKSGRPQRKPPRSFSYRISIADSGDEGFFRLSDRSTTGCLSKGVGSIALSTRCTPSRYLSASYLQPARRVLS